jgi:WD40 repeat protein
MNIYGYLSILSLALLILALPTAAQDTSEGYRYLQPAWSNAGDQNSAVENDTIYIRHVTSGQIIRALRTCPEGWMQAWSPDDSLLAIICNGNQIVVLDSTSGNLITVLQDSTDYLGAITWSPDGSRLLATVYDTRQNLFVWDTRSWQLIAVNLPAAGFYMTFDPAGEKIVIGMPGGFGIVDSSTYIGLSVIRVDPNLYYIVKAIWSPNGQTIATSSLHGVVRVWDPDSGALLSEFVANPHAVISDRLQSFSGPSWIHDIVYSADGRYILTISEDGTVQSWDTILETVQSQAMLPAVGTARFSSFGGQLTYMRLGLLATDVASASANQGSLLEVTVPFATQEMLDALLRGCEVPTNQQTRTDLSTLTAQVAALPDTQIPPGCRADLLAVAAALQAQ